MKCFNVYVIICVKCTLIYLYFAVIKKLYLGIKLMYFSDHGFERKEWFKNLI